MAKKSYELTNKKDYEGQMCRYLDRCEKVRLFSVFQRWLDICDDDEDTFIHDDNTDNGSSKNDRHRNEEPEDDDDCVGGGDDDCDREDDDDCDDDDLFDDNDDNYEALTSGCLSHPDRIPALLHEFLPKPTRDAFKEDATLTPRNDTTAFILNGRKQPLTLCFDTVASTYNLPASVLNIALENFMHGPTRTMRQSFSRKSGFLHQKLCVWKKVRIQLRTIQDEDRILPPLTVLAMPPTPQFPLGLYNFVLVRHYADVTQTGIQGTS